MGLSFKSQVDIEEFEIEELEKVRQTILKTHSELEKATNLEIQTQAQERLNTAFRQLMHDLYQPVTNIKILANQLIKKPIQPEKKVQLYQKIDKLSGQTLTLLESAKKNVPYEINPARGIDIREVIQSATDQALATVPRACNLNISVNLPVEPVLKDIDPINMERAVTNLVKNALEAAKTKVVVSARNDNQGWVTIAVEDDGEGLAQSEASLHLIGRGTSTKDGGSGLGLSSSNRIVKSHGGQIVYSPSMLGGAAFEIRIEDGKA